MHSKNKNYLLQQNNGISNHIELRTHSMIATYHNWILKKRKVENLKSSFSIYEEESNFYIH